MYLYEVHVYSRYSWVSVTSERVYNPPNYVNPFFRTCPTLYCSCNSNINLIEVTAVNPEMDREYCRKVFNHL